MKLLQNPFPIIFSHGDDMTQLACLELFGLHGSPHGKRLMANAMVQQRPDGAFASGLSSRLWGIRETVRNTLLLLRVGLAPDTPFAYRAVRFVLRQQRPDGGWSENPALTIPQEQTWLSNERSVTWITADVVDLLRQVGLEHGVECQSALRWLLSMQNQQGGWPSLADGDSERDDPDCTAQVSFLLGELYGNEGLAYRRGRALFDRHLDACAQDAERGYWIRPVDGARGQLDVYHLTHLLLSWLMDSPRRFRAGYDVADPRVWRIAMRLAEIQRDDGGWQPFFSETASATYTLIAVKVLVLCGAISRDDLRKTLKHSLSGLVP